MYRKFLICNVAISTVLLTAVGARAAPVEIFFYDRYTTPEQQSFDKWLVDTFNDRNAGRIHVTLGGTPDETFKSKINSVLRSPDAPDVFFSWEGGWAKYIIDSGYAAPLDSYYAKYGWNKSLSPAGIALATLEGDKYFVPEMMSASVVWYRPDLFEKFHVAVPTTWDAFMADTNIFKAQGITPTMLANQQQWPAQFLWTALLVNKYGVGTYDQLLTRKIAWTDPRVVDTFAMMKQLADDGAFEQGANGLDVSPAVVPFSQGKAATWYQGSFMLTQFLGANGKPNFPLDYFPFPKIGDEVPSISVFVENTLMINANSHHKDDAAEFMNWVVSKEAQTRYALSAHMLYPANIEVDLSSLDPMVKRLGDMIATYHQATFMHVDHALSPAVSDPYLQALQAVLIGRATPQQAANTTEQAAEGDQGPVKP
jgi:raffinose/stachyose/melibiose transport system substrate-binding protein